MTYRRALNPRMLTIHELGKLIGRAPSTIKKDRMSHPDHPLFGKAIKNGSAPNSPLLWWRGDVQEYFETMGQRVDWSSIDGPSVEEEAQSVPPRSPDSTVVLMTMVADLAEGIAGVLLDVAAKARAGEYGRGAEG
ncbi:hypothetical protein [Rhodococcus pyridinivorans]|uniref:Uncharacterized protein n=1 Tax=Rhodococcus pyridinivorans TaxID=103816 RepID=A0A7M2XHP5_9NOCA|nr:hypothetical protein [Rhodococcus pyridinivorans]QOV97225.1 hypothetical protein INP59_14735 [Rhodococcus pyridinivorans]